jgi:oxygen-independent coproporphyrinogen-3 oxidase
MSEPYRKKDNEFVAWYPLALTEDQAPSVWSSRPTAYYVHIPFCTAICDYCGFAVDKLKNANVASYLDALEREIDRYGSTGRLAKHQFICGHFGGGTPSAIDAEALVKVKRLIDSSFDVTPDAEVTVEVNPISFTLEKAHAYKDAGVNRISFGVQSFNDRTLATIGRPHRAKDVERTLEVIRDVGFENFSLDLIYGVPGQTLADLNQDLLRAVETGATHLSCFRLEIIPLTVLKLREAAYQLPARLSVDTLNEMDELVQAELTARGYRGYGAFNFARPGFESVHNAIAFIAPQAEYIGFGNSSYSFINEHIYCNYADLPSYKAAVFEGRDPIALASRVNTLEMMSRFFVLGLKFFRVSRTAFIERFGLRPEDVFGELLDKLADRGLLFIEGEEYVLTPTGRLYVNNVVKEFFVGESKGKPQHHQFVANLTVNQIEMYSRLRAKVEAEMAGAGVSPGSKV